MKQKLWAALAPGILLFAAGLYAVHIGLFDGRGIASEVFSPLSNQTLESLITACTYFPIIIGIALLALGIALIGIWFNKWLHS